MNRKPLKILFAIAEAYPFIKVGGLADVGASLPKALARLGHDVRVVLPGYSCVGAGRPIASLDIPMGPKTERAHVDHLGVHGGVTVYTVGNESYFHREAAYGGYEDDDVAPFVLLSKAVAAFATCSGWKPDVIHCNDWHLGLVPQYVRFGPDRAALGYCQRATTSRPSSSSWGQGMNALPESTETAGTFANKSEPWQMESSTRRATEPAPALLAHSSSSSTRPSSSVRSTILSFVSPLSTQRRGPSASQSCLVEAARMFFTVPSPPAFSRAICSLVFLV